MFAQTTLISYDTEAFVKTEAGCTVYLDLSVVTLRFTGTLWKGIKLLTSFLLGTYKKCLFHKAFNSLKNYFLPSNLQRNWIKKKCLEISEMCNSKKILCINLTKKSLPSDFLEFVPFRLIFIQLRNFALPIGLLRVSYA